jgi:predicted nucleic acid-binding protein
MSAPTVAVLDSNGIIGLAKANCFPLLQDLFTEICVPPAVVAEITSELSQMTLQTALGKWLTELLPSADALRQVAFINQEADRHVLALAIDRQASIPDCFLVTGDENYDGAPCGSGSLRLTLRILFNFLLKAAS